MEEVTRQYPVLELTQSGPHPLASLVKFLVLPIVVLVTAGLFVSAPSVQSGRVYDFFANYYGNVTHENQRQALYWTDLTLSFRNHNSWQSYTAFWRTQKSVTVVSVIPVAGNLLEFDARLIFHPLSGGTIEETYNFWLTCEGFMGGIRSRISFLGCPASDLEIDNQQLTTGG
jgi:hypothetical protein